MAIKKCPVCRGQKKVLGLGALEKDCKECGAVGYKDVVEDKDTDQFLGASEITAVQEPVKKTWSRRKKVA